MANDERRAQERFFLELQAKFLAESDIAEKKAKEETIAANISAGGAFLLTKRKLPLASKVYLEFLIGFEDLKKLRFILSRNSLKTLAGKNLWVKATGIVIRSEEQGIAIIFDQDYQLSPLEVLDDE